MSDVPCEWLTLRDAMCGRDERHDLYCLLSHEWCPLCDGCDDYSPEE